MPNPICFNAFRGTALSALHTYQPHPPQHHIHRGNPGRQERNSVRPVTARSNRCVWLIPIAKWPVVLFVALLIGLMTTYPSHAQSTATPKINSETNTQTTFESTASELISETQSEVQQKQAEQDQTAQDQAAQNQTVETPDETPSVNPVLFVLEKITEFIKQVLFFDIFFGLAPTPFPFVVLTLGAGAVFFTLYHGFINIRGFKHAFDIVRGKYQDSNDIGDITPFRALTSALSATVGLGNIAGVAIAVKSGGPGAVFWMMFLGLFGMTSKFHESTLAQLFRTKNPDGTISGGGMYYISQGMADLYGPKGRAIGKVFAVVFAVFCIGGAIGAGNMFQANQAFESFYSTFVAPESQTLAAQNRATIDPEQLRSELSDTQLMALMTRQERRNAATLDEASLTAALAIERQEVSAEKIRQIALPSQIETLLPPDEVKQAAEKSETTHRKVSIGFGLIMATIVGVVIVGGITRIGAATSKIVPTMCLIYCGGCLTIIVLNLGHLPQIIGLVFANAFAFESVWGGLLGAMVIGFTRATFSSEAGLGSSAIAHSAAMQKEPIREGLVASLEPFIDTIVICFITAMAVLITDAHLAPELAEEQNGAKITLYAFSQVGALSSWFPSLLTISIMLFAFSTMISWCYYGERAWIYLFGSKSLLVFRLIFVGCVFVGVTTSLGVVMDFSDALLLSMAAPNIIGGILLAPIVKRELKKYLAKLKSGEFDQPTQTDTNVNQGADI